MDEEKVDFPNELLTGITNYEFSLMYTAMNENPDISEGRGQIISNRDFSKF